MSNNHDQEIINGLLSGDEKGFKAFYKQELNPFISWSKKEWNMDDQAAHDLYQDVQMYVYENILQRKLKNLTSSLRTYLYAIAKNQMSLKFRKATTVNEHESKLTEHLSFLTGLDQVDDTKLKQVKLIQEAIKLMLEPCKTLLKLFYYDGLSFKVISERMDYKNESVAKNQKKRCLDRLRSNYSAELKDIES
ncbi:MAG: sigma-70 family RNA polymerase sigma factor [bacterium]|nr:sigma-70 family RNA polymerase sigma factor [bacterium]